MNSIGIVGAGLLGRLLAYQLTRKNYAVTLFDRDRESGSNSCGYTGAGMLAPYSELESSDRVIFELGKSATEAWRTIVDQFATPVFFQNAGTLVVAHNLDSALVARVRKRIEEKLSAEESRSGVQVLNSHDVGVLEESLAGRFSSGLYLPLEGQIDNRQLLSALGSEIRCSSVKWVCNAEVNCVRPRSITVNSNHHLFDCVIDCRGTGAMNDLLTLRAVRGEIIDLHASAVVLKRPVRLMHPRYPLYIVPRQENRFLVGATSIECNDTTAVSVQSTLELLSAAFSVHPGFAQASIVEMRVNCRPAFPDNLPKIMYQPGLVIVNGLYRHGFLVAPKISELVCELLETGKPNIVNPIVAKVFEEESICKSPLTVPLSNVSHH